MESPATPFLIRAWTAFAIGLGAVGMLAAPPLLAAEPPATDHAKPNACIAKT